MTERVLAQPFNRVWGILVKNLAKNSFVTKDIDKASRFIDLAFSLDDPKNYVNCGLATREYSYKQESNIYRYEVAGSSEYKVAGKWGRGDPYVASISRRTSLEGRASLYLDLKGETETVITTTVRYVWTFRIYGSEEFMNSVSIMSRTNPNREMDKGTITFSTNQVGTDKDAKNNDAVIKCCSTGLLESKILDLAGN
ncbi:MAG: hypothetical protein EXR97_02575 [Nitrospiraceae bacterium]|nr:hypothetical protein [Nitrospiraceae bacterium]MSR24258.1 hypothetical protein [Nitrospiraceae bacterium]